MKFFKAKMVIFYILMSTYYVSGPILSSSHVLVHLITSQQRSLRGMIIIPILQMRKLRYKGGK